MKLISFDHPGLRIEWVPSTGQTRTRQNRYDHTDSQIEILSVTTTLATSNIRMTTLKPKGTILLLKDEPSTKNSL